MFTCAVVFSTVKVVMDVMIPMQSPTQVLIVEDDEAIASLIADALSEESGAHTRCLHNGREAIAFLADHTVDLLILDYQLPGANGIEVYDTLRRSERTMLTPVLFLTANDKRAEFQRRGLAFMRKPFNLGELLATIEERLAAREVSAASS
jgi:DNA-binding response OmpR family regulator